MANENKAGLKMGECKREFSLDRNKQQFKEGEGAFGIPKYRTEE